MKTAILFLFVSVAIISQAIAQKKVQDWKKTKGDSLIQSNTLPGLIIGVIHKGTRNYYDFGVANKELKTRFDANTVFEIGSITKTFTAYIVEKIFLEKGLDENKSILTYMPPGSIGNRQIAAVTMLQLLNHSSGMPRIPANLPAMSSAPYDRYSQDSLFRYLKTAKIKLPNAYEYSNLGMGLAGVLAARIMNTPYKELLQRYVFSPFGMKNMEQGIDANSNKSEGYMNDRQSDYWNMLALYPAGGIKSNALQMLTYLDYCIKNAEKDTVLNKILQPTKDLSNNMSIAKGWHLLKKEDHPIIYWHNGGTYGFSTFAAFTKSGNGVIVAANRFNANNITDALGLGILERLAQ